MSHRDLQESIRRIMDRGAGHIAPLETDYYRGRTIDAQIDQRDGKFNAFVNAAIVNSRGLKTADEKGE